MQVARGTAARRAGRGRTSRTASVRPDSWPELGDVVRVLHEPDVEDEVRLERHAVLEAEADELDRELVGPDVVAEPGEQPLAQLAQRQVRRVDDDVGLGADRVEQAALLGDRAGDPALVAERVAVARLARSGGSGPRRGPRGRTTCGRMPRPSSAPRIAAKASVASPDRTSSTIATLREALAVVDDTSSARSGSSSPGRLSTTV